MEHQVPNKPLVSPNESMRGENSGCTRLSSRIFPWKQKRCYPQSVNVVQPRVEWHLTDAWHPEPNTDVHTFLSVGTSKHLDSVVVGNHKELRGVMIIPQMILIHKNRIWKVYICRHKFFVRIATILSGPEPKSMESVVLHLCWFKWKEAIKEE